MENTGNWPIEDGMLVYGKDGDHLGDVRNYSPQVGYLDVQKGWLFHKDFYVLLSDVAVITGEGLTLSLTKDDLGHNRYSSPPVTGEDAYIEGVIVEESTVFDETEPPGGGD